MIFEKRKLHTDRHTWAGSSPSPSTTSSSPHPRLHDTGDDEEEHHEQNEDGQDGPPCADVVVLTRGASLLLASRDAVLVTTRFAIAKAQILVLLCYGIVSFKGDLGVVLGT